MAQSKGSGGRGDSGGGNSVTSIASALKGIDFPCSRDDLVKHAQSNNASKSVIEDLRNIPDQEFETMADVMSGFGSSSHDQ